MTFENILYFHWILNIFARHADLVGGSPIPTFFVTKFYLSVLSKCFLEFGSSNNFFLGLHGYTLITINESLHPRGGGTPLPKDPPKIVFFFFPLFFLFCAHWIKIEKTQKKKHFYVTLFRDRSVEDCQGYRILVLFLNEISREKVVRKPSRFPFRDWRVHRKYHIKVRHFGTLSMHSSISKWEAWWTFATFCAKQAGLKKSKKYA